MNWQEILIGLIPIIISPIIAYIISRVGISGKKSEIEYHIKRLELVEKMKQSSNSLDNSVKEKFDWTVLDTEITDILNYIDANSTREAERILNKYQQTLRIKRMLILPKPQALGGWVASIMYYFYLFLSIIFLIMTILIPPYSTQHLTTGVKMTLNLSGITLIISIILAVYTHRYAIRNIKNVISRSKMVKKM